MTTPLLSRIQRRADDALAALRTASGRPVLPDTRGADLLQQRARLMQLRAQGQRSANGSCHLLPCADGWLAINLSRDSDWSLLPALLEQDVLITAIEHLQAVLRNKSAPALEQRGALLGLAIATANSTPVINTRAIPGNYVSVIARGAVRSQRRATPTVLDLSTLWAGPLCSRLLQECGARVIEIHNAARQDGMALNTASGAAAFYRWLHNGKETVALDFRRREDIDRLQQLLRAADIVIEGSRPRALQQLGIDAGLCVQQQPGLVWLSITGYGRTGDNSNRIAFGDDAAIAAGLFEQENGKPVFIGDAIADPLTGLHAALAAFTHWQQGDAVLLDVNLHTTACWCVRS